MKFLNLPSYSHRISSKDGKEKIFDFIRKKYVALTPEEWVRQNFLRFIVEEKNYPSALILVEGSINVNGLNRRCDAVVYGTDAEPKMIIECKAPEVVINDLVFEQIAAYNMALKVEFLVVTNGVNHYCCKIDFEMKKYQFLKDIPDWQTIKA